MQTTLAERIKKAMQGPPKVSGVAIAMACGITPTSVSDWRTGKSKTIEGANLLAAAKVLQVRADWLASGVGPMRAVSEVSHKVEETVVQYQVKRQPDDIWIQEAVLILKRLKPTQRAGAVATLRSYVQNLGPPRDGQALSMAAKNEREAQVTKKAY